MNSLTIQDILPKVRARDRKCGRTTQSTPFVTYGGGTAVRQNTSRLGDAFSMKTASMNEGGIPDEHPKETRPDRARLPEVVVRSKTAHIFF